MKKPILIIIGIFIVVAVGARLFWFFPNFLSFNFETGSNIASSTEVTSLTLASREVPEGWREYRSEQYRFSLFYPENLSVREFDEGGGAATITFENIDTLQGFQIFIVPFVEPQITEERFRQDIPSGVRENLLDITVDGATGAAFYSENDLLGETREVWFIHGGYLFEVTTLKLLEQSLQSVMQTWQFIP